MYSSKLASFLATLLCASMILSMLPMAQAEPVIPETKTFLSEDTEDVTSWTSTWSRTDADPGASTDLWGPTMQKAHSGERSAYCARSGYNSHYLNATNVQPADFNLLNAADNVSHTTYVQRYDTNMDTIMRKYVSGAAYYTNITLSFWFYSDTGASDAAQPHDGTEVGYDFFNVVYYTGSNSSLTKHVAWTNNQTEAFGQTWTYASLNIPNNTTWIGFEFVSGSVAPTGGDASDAFTAYGVRTTPTGSTGMKEGVYIDDISCVGSEPVASIPLTTAVEDLAPYQNNYSFPVGWVDNDPLDITLEWMYLYYRVNGTGDWIKYTTAEKPFGAFVNSPITFNVTHDGTYEFFTQGKAYNGTLEEKRDAADASTIVDTVDPTSTIAFTGDLVGGAYDGSVTFSINSTDPASGINQTSYRVNEGSWLTYASPVELTATGSHTIEYFATDNAGNAEDMKSGDVNITAGSNVTPALAISDMEDQYTSGANVTISFNVTSNFAIDKLEYSVDGSAFVEMDTNATSLTLMGLSDGEHTVVIKATDIANHTMQDEVSFTMGESSGNGGDILADPLVLGGIGAAAVAAIGGAVWYTRRKKP